MKNQKISIIIPFFNEKHELKEVIKIIKKQEKINKKLIYEYIFINDYSSDNSLKVINNEKKKLINYISKKIKIYTNKKNIGFARTVMKGFGLAKSAYVLFVSGDGEVDISEITNQINFNYDLCIFQRKSMQSRPASRIIISKIYKRLISFIFKIKKIDFNGVSMIKKNKIKKLNLTSNSFFFNAEIIIKSTKNKLNISYNNYFNLRKKNMYKSTSLNFKQFFYVFLDLIKTKCAS
jgi:glycosyltransferase involved in cell wall biosynthesis